MKPTDGDESRLSEEEREHAQRRRRLRTPIVYEVVRQEGEEELVRPLFSLWWSGIAAGIGISASLLAEGLLHHHLPDSAYRPLVENLGYSLGFLIVILGRLQLFTENTITTILPLLAETTRSKLWCTMRLWAVVFLANMVGTLLTAAVLTFFGVVKPGHLSTLVEVAAHAVEPSPMETLSLAIPAGFLVAAIVWILPSAEGSSFWVILSLTYLIALGDFAHVVVGSSEVFVLMLNGGIGFNSGVFGFILPALVGNIIGGTGLFALLAYGQVREEM